MIFVVVSTGHFDPLIAECVRLHPEFDFYAQIGSSTTVPPFPHFRTGPPEKLEKAMNEAELVISHAGTGMLSMLYRLRKKSIVIPKQMRYGEANDGQVELAKKWGAIGISLLCLDVKDLRQNLLKSRDFVPHFPNFPSVGQALESELSSSLPMRVEPELALS